MPVAAAIGGSALVGAVATTSAANKGAKAQMGAAERANDTQMGIFNQTRSDLSPYNQAGQLGSDAILRALGIGADGTVSGGGYTPGWQAFAEDNPGLLDSPNGYRANKAAWAAAGIPDEQSFVNWYLKANNIQTPADRTAADYWKTGRGSIAGALMAPITSAPIAQDQQTLERLPGYQFALSQGLKSVQNSAAARGLGASGAALKGASGFATGLANQKYLDYFNAALGHQNQLFNQAQTNRATALEALTGVATRGQNAAAQVGTIGQATGANIGQNITGAGNAQAAANIAGGQAIAGAGNQMASYLYSQNLLKQLGATAPATSGAARGLYGPPV